MAQAMVGDFMKQISTRMATKISTGQSVAVRFTIDPGSAINMDTEINNIMPLSDILVSWVKRHAKNGKYHTQGRTSTLLAFSDILWTTPWRTVCSRTSMISRWRSTSTSRG